MADEARAELKLAAFIGWQNYLVQPVAKKSDKKMEFSKWLKSLRLGDEPEVEFMSKAEIKARVMDLDKRVAEAFRRQPAQA